VQKKIQSKATKKSEMGWKTKVNIQLNLENFTSTHKNFRSLIPLKNIYDSVSDNESYEETNKQIKSTNRSFLLRKIWNTFILFSIIYSATYGILRNTLQPHETQSFLFLFELLLDTCFIADIVIQFFTTVYLKNKIYDDKKSIALNYMRNWLFWDLVSSIPLSIALYINKQIVSESILKQKSDEI